MISPYLCLHNTFMGKPPFKAILLLETTFVSTFGAYMSRDFDQIRMSQDSDVNIKFGAPMP